MQIKIIKRFIFNKITSLNNHCNVIDVLNLLDDYIIELDKKMLESKSEKLIFTQNQLKKTTFSLVQRIERLHYKEIIPHKMTPYKITNLIQLIDKIKGEKEEIKIPIEKVEYIGKYKNMI